MSHEQVYRIRTIAVGQIGTCDLLSTVGPFFLTGDFQEAYSITPGVMEAKVTLPFRDPSVITLDAPPDGRTRTASTFNTRERNTCP